MRMHHLSENSTNERSKRDTCRRSGVVRMKRAYALWGPLAPWPAAAFDQGNIRAQGLTEKAASEDVCRQRDQLSENLRFQNPTSPRLVCATLIAGHPQG